MPQHARLRPCFMTHVSPSQPRTFQGNAFATTLPHNPIRALKTSLALRVRQIIPAEKKKRRKKASRLETPLHRQRLATIRCRPSTMVSNCGVASRPNTWPTFTFRPVPGPLVGRWRKKQRCGRLFHFSFPLVALTRCPFPDWPGLALTYRTLAQPSSTRSRPLLFAKT